MKKLEKMIRKLLSQLGLLPLMAIVATLSACAPSLQSVATEPRARELAAAERDVERCESLSRLESALRYTSATSAALAGGSGLAVIPIDDRDAQRALGVTAAGFGVVSAGAEAWRAQVAADWQRSCE